VFSFCHSKHRFLRKNGIANKERRELLRQQIDTGLEIAKPAGVAKLLRFQLLRIRVDSREDVVDLAVRHVLQEIDNKFIFKNVGLSVRGETAKRLAAEGRMVGLTNFEAVFQKVENGAQALLAIHNLSAHASRLRIDILAHVDFRNGLSPHDCVYEEGTCFVVPHIATLKLRLQQQLSALIPLFKISDTVVASMKGLLHFFTVLAYVPVFPLVFSFRSMRIVSDVLGRSSTRHANKPETVRFYANRLKRLLEWEPFRDAQLDRIDEGLIARYIGQRRKSVGVVAVNRELATLRRILHVAHEWKLIKAVPKVKLLPGEQSRDFVLDHATEQRYLAVCPPLLHDVAVVLLDSGLRLGEALALRWSDIHLEPAGSARYGWLQVQDGKSKGAKRTVPLAARIGSLLREKQKTANSEWVFPGESPDSHVLNTSVAHMHAKVCRPGKGKARRYLFPALFVLHSMRHTCLTRLGEAGADAFTIMKLAGHSSVTVSQRYIHPTGETVQLAFDRLEALNQRALESSSSAN
jgi:integrase